MLKVGIITASDKGFHGKRIDENGKNCNTAVILAGGKSIRMGFDKQFLMINEKRLIHHLLDQLSKEFSDIIIVSNTPQHYSGIQYKVVSDEYIGKGPLGGIHMGLKEASSEYVYLIACDMPRVNLAYIRYMKRVICRSQTDVCITMLGDMIEPFNAFYSKRLISKIEKALVENKQSVLSLIKEVNYKYISEHEARKFSPNLDMFLNLNTKQDLDLFLKYSI